MRTTHYIVLLNHSGVYVCVCVCDVKTINCRSNYCQLMRCIPIIRCYVIDSSTLTIFQV